MTDDAASPASPAVETERLIVRDWRDDEADRMFDMYSRLEVVRFLGTVPTPMTSVEEAQEAIRRARERNAAIAPLGWWAVVGRDTGHVAGTVGLVPLETGETEVIWHLHPDSMGNGYATESARAVLARAHAHGIEEVIALVDVANEPSRNVALRLGLEPRGGAQHRGKVLEVFVSHG